MDVRDQMRWTLIGVVVVAAGLLVASAKLDWLRRHTKSLTMVFAIAVALLVAIECVPRWLEDE